MNQTDETKDLDNFYFDVDVDFDVGTDIDINIDIDIDIDNCTNIFIETKIDINANTDASTVNPYKTIGQSGGASRRRVCYQRGLPRLVL